MLITTTNTIEGKKIVKYIGLVSGETIIGANIFKDLFAGIRDIVGGRSGSYEQVLREGKNTAINEMQQYAAAMGANAIWGAVGVCRSLGPWVGVTDHGGGYDAGDDRGAQNSYRRDVDGADERAGSAERGRQGARQGGAAGACQKWHDEFRVELGRIHRGPRWSWLGLCRVHRRFAAPRGGADCRA